MILEITLCLGNQFVSWSSPPNSTSPILGILFGIFVVPAVALISNKFLTRNQQITAILLSSHLSSPTITSVLDYDSQETHNELHPDNPSEEGSAVTEVAHIIPHCFNAQNSDGGLGDSRMFVWRIMTMFDPRISHRLAGTAIDSPRNAITMCAELHHRFRQLKWYLEPVRGAPRIIILCI